MKLILIHYKENGLTAQSPLPANDLNVRGIVCFLCPT